MFIPQLLKYSFISTLVSTYLLPSALSITWEFEEADDDDDEVQEVPSCFDVVLCPQNAEGEMYQVIMEHMSVNPKFITENEERILVKELEDEFGEMEYESADMFGYLSNYRQLEKLAWNSSESDAIVKKIKKFAFPSTDTFYEYDQVIDYQENGYIDPHIDSEKRSGNRVVGLNLLSDCVMRFTYEENKDVRVNSKIGVQKSQKSLVFDVLLKRRSLYVMKDEVRYRFKHEILNGVESQFKGKPVKKGRRIAIIFRNNRPRGKAAAN